MGSGASSWGTSASSVPPSFTDGGAAIPAPPGLGTNLALGKPATGSTPCAATEGPAKAVDGVLGVDSKFCSLAASKYLQVDLGSTQNVGAFVVKHAGLGGEQTGWNTGAFDIQTSTDGSTWTTRVSVSGNRASRTYHPISTVSARYVRLNIGTPANDGNTAARITEFEVYPPGGATLTNVALNRPATADSSCNANEGPEKADNGSVSGGTSDKWCSGGAAKFWQVDLGSNRTIQSITVRHAGAGGESTSWNTRDFALQVSTDGTTWATVATVTGNTASVTTHPITPTSARYVRLTISTPTQTTDTAARIYEVEVYA